MAGGNLYDEARVRAMPAGAEIVLGKRDLATPAALDLAFAKGIHVRWMSAGSAPLGASAAPAGSPEGCNCVASGSTSCTWRKVLAQDGTYVVEVRAGRAVVHRLTPSGPVPLKEG